MASLLREESRRIQRAVETNTELPRFDFEASVDTGGQQIKAGDVVVMDNLSSHQVAGVGRAIRKAGAAAVMPLALASQT